LCKHCVMMLFHPRPANDVHFPHGVRRLTSSQKMHASPAFLLMRQVLNLPCTHASRWAACRHSDGREVVGFTQQCATRVGSACSETAKFSVNWMLQEAAATNDTNQQSPSPNPNPSPSPLPDGGNNATSTGTPICSPECVHGVCSAPGVCNCSSTPYIGATCETPSEGTTRQGEGAPCTRLAADCTFSLLCPASNMT
jgi:hypothetical protein